MKKLWIILIVLVLLVGIGGVGGLYYIKPEKKLDLTYEKVALWEHALDMVHRQSTELIVSGEHLNHLAKKTLADNPQVEEDIVVTGAHFTLEGDLLLADLNIVWKNRLSAGLQVTYQLHWQAPNVRAVVKEARLKGIKLPNSMFSDRMIPISQELPKLLKIKELVWGQGEVKVLFQKPTLEELRNLLG